MKIPFEELYWLFTGGTPSRGVCRLNLEEAACLYKYVKKIDNPLCVEIGRYYGGSTIILLSAGAKVITIDNHSKNVQKCAEYDNKLEEWAAKKGMDDKLEIVVCNSDEYAPGGLEIDVLFLDGGHSYEVVRKDLDNWLRNLKTGGMLFLHDINIKDVHKAFDEKRLLFGETNKVSSLCYAKKIKELNNGSDMGS